MNSFNVKVNDAKNWLIRRGYQVVDKIGNDLIMIGK